MYTLQKIDPLGQTSGDEAIFHHHKSIYTDDLLIRHHKYL